MFWCNELINGINTQLPQIINDSKTPSGRAHVGALRGVVIHDVIFRLLREKGVAVRYLYGVDDYDPLDELPYGKDEHFSQYLGMPLCQVPPPPGSQSGDMADYYISEFFSVFKELGIHPETYRMRDIYRSGQFDKVIDTILCQANIVRQIYKKVSKSERPAHWYPFQVICEQCGRIGTTEVSDYDGQEVTYTCRPDLVKWAKGCGYQGKMSPFRGNGKLPWKLEWVAKWQSLGITIEGAGKDHATKGGSRDVASQCLRDIFHREPPLNVPYEFFLVGGAKMSSSRGVGESARDMADFLPPELLRFLMIRPHPKKPINFSADEEYIIKLFNEFDRYHEQTYHRFQVSEEIKQTYLLSEVTPEGDYFNANIQLLQALVQMPHIDPVREIDLRKGSSLTPVDLKHLQRRIESVKYWLSHYAQEQEKLQLQLTLPVKAQELTALQRAFLHQLAQALPTTDWIDDQLQTKIFEVARLTPIKQPLAFQAIYRILFNRDSGPKAGNLFMFLNQDFLIQRFQELPYSPVDFWQESCITTQQLEDWLQEHKTTITAIKAIPHFSLKESHDMSMLEFAVTFTDHKTYLQRVIFEQNAEMEHYLKKFSEQTKISV